MPIENNSTIILKKRLNFQTTQQSEKGKRIDTIPALGRAEALNELAFPFALDLHLLDDSLLLSNSNILFSKGCESFEAAFLLRREIDVH